MLFEITVIACLQLNPTNCGNYYIEAQGLSANPSAAYIEAQALVAKWIDERPGLVLKGFDLQVGRGA